MLTGARGLSLIHKCRCLQGKTPKGACHVDTPLKGRHLKNESIVLWRTLLFEMEQHALSSAESPGGGSQNNILHCITWQSR